VSAPIAGYWTKSTRSDSGSTSTTGWRGSTSTCRRCANGATISRRWRCFCSSAWEVRGAPAAGCGRAGQLQAYEFPGNVPNCASSAACGADLSRRRDPRRRSEPAHVTVPALPGAQPLARSSAPYPRLLDTMRHATGRPPRSHYRAHALSQAQALRPQLIRGGWFTCCRAP